MSSIEEISGDMTASGGGIYIHVPFCRRKCIYCDFFSAGDRIADWEKYIEAVRNELSNRIDEMACPTRTIYLGGGTPSLMPEPYFNQLADILRPYSEEAEEFTIEVNPDDVTETMLKAWKRGGVNRLSIGIQSFDDQLLSVIGRRHDGATAERAYRLARKYFDNISIDLMFGLPGQNPDIWRDDIRRAISLRPEHVSAYSLMYEEGTALTTLRDTGRINETDENISEKMFRMLIDEMRAAGYEHYEISNFSLPGYRSRHNSSYWRQAPYIGIGPSAHSYDGKRTRKANRRDLRGYLEYWTKNHHDASKDNVCDTEYLTDEELKDEYIMTRMRTLEGIPIDDFSARFGKEACDYLKRKCQSDSIRPHIESNDSNISLKESAILMSDSIILDLSL